MAWHGFAVPALLGAALVARRKRTAPGAALTLKCLPSLRRLRRFLPLPQGLRSRGAVKGKCTASPPLTAPPPRRKGRHGEEGGGVRHWGCIWRMRSCIQAGSSSVSWYSRWVYICSRTLRACGHPVEHLVDFTLD